VLKTPKCAFSESKSNIHNIGVKLTDGPQHWVAKTTLKER